MTGDLIEYTPGDRVGVEVVADADGDMPTRGYGVEVVGENRGSTEVQVVQGQDSYGLGILTTDPDDHDDGATYSEGDSAGMASVLLHCHVEHYYPSDGYSPSVGDAVKWDDGGTVTAWASDDTTATASPMGVVFGLGSRDIGAEDKITVARFQ